MAEDWTTYGDYVNLGVIRNSPPANYIRGLFAALSERMLSIGLDETGGTVYTWNYTTPNGFYGSIPYWPVFGIGRPWYNQHMVVDLSEIYGEGASVTLSGDVLWVIRDCITQLCDVFINYKKYNYSLQGYNARDYEDFNNPWKWTFTELLEEVKDEHPYYRSRYPVVGQLPHPKSTAEHVQLYYYMINKLKTFVITYGNSPYWQNTARVSVRYVKPDTQKYLTFNEARQELLNSDWEVGTLTPTNFATNFAMISEKKDGEYFIWSTFMDSYQFQTPSSVGRKALVDCYVQPVQLGFPFFGMTQTNVLWRTRQDLVVNGQEIFDPFVKDYFDKYVATPDPYDKKAVSNLYDVVVGGIPNYLNVGTLFYNFRDYETKF